MDGLGNYKIDLNRLRTNAEEYEFDLDDAFFQAAGSDLVRGGQAKAVLSVRKTPEGYRCSFTIKGQVQVPCDRCLEPMEVAVETEREVTVKLGTDYADDGEVIWLPSDDTVLDVAWIMYEFIALEVPLTHVHPPGLCNQGMVEALQGLLVEDAADECHQDAARKSAQEAGAADPRWGKLKELLDNN